MNADFGCDGIFAIDLKSVKIKEQFMQGVQNKGLGYIAVGLGYFKTFIRLSGKSTLSKIPKEMQREMYLSEGFTFFRWLRSQD